MKKVIKKILVLACVAVLAVSSMTALAAEPRAIACPNVCGGVFSVYSKDLISKELIGTQKCSSGGVDYIDKYTYNVIYQCTNCNYKEYRQESDRVILCGHE